MLLLSGVLTALAGPDGSGPAEASRPMNAIH